ncbi:MAG: imelysin family protein [Pontibacterium sp.]
MFQRLSLIPLWIPVFCLFFISGLLHASPRDNTWQALNISLVQEQIIPRYQTLAEQSKHLLTTTEQLCAAPGQTTLNNAHSAFHNTMDAWQGIQHVQFGPVTFLMRNFSLQFWPDKKNLIGKQLNKLQQSKTQKSLTAEYFRGASIAVKGLPALERLLFDNKTLDAYSCQLTIAIAKQVHHMSQATYREWLDTQLNEFVLAPGGSGYYEDSTEAATDLMKSLVEPVEVIRDLKLLRPLHKSARQAKPLRAESWRSQRSLRNIQLNMAALSALYQGNPHHSLKALLAAEGQKVLSEQIGHSFDTLKIQLEQIPTPLYQAVKDPASHQQLRLISVQMKQLHQQLETAMKSLNIQLGFNSRDGD